MLVKVLGIIDFMAGLILIFGVGIEVPSTLLILFGIVLLIKSFLGGIPKNFGSLTDLSASIIFVLFIFFPIHWAICLIAAILLIQKGLVSFL